MAAPLMPQPEDLPFRRRHGHHRQAHRRSVRMVFSTEALTQEKIHVENTILAPFISTEAYCENYQIILSYPLNFGTNIKSQKITIDFDINNSIKYKR